MKYPTKDTDDFTVDELKNKYGGKGNNWIPIDKAAACYLPTDRPYTRLEALFSYQKDLDEGKNGNISGYAKLWKWSRTKVRKFLSEIETEEGHKKDRRRTDKEQAIHVINKDLWNVEKQKKNRRRTEEEQKKDTTIHPNPNPKEKRYASLSKNGEFHKLQNWVWDNLPHVSKIENQLSFAECERLIDEYDKTMIRDVLESMENWKGIEKKNTSVNKTLRNWINKRLKDSNGKATNPIDSIEAEQERIWGRKL